MGLGFLTIYCQATLSGDLDEMTAEAGLSEEKAQRAMIDAARLADELRAEQDAAQGLERERKLLDAQVKDMQSRVDEAQTQALKGGKKAMTKMDTRIRELESELDAENRRMADAQKNMRKSERKIKELSYQQDEDRKNHERMQALIDQLQGKIKSYKKQIEEAEEIAALNLAKYRQAQNSVADATERADSNEQTLAKNRARARSASLGPVSITHLYTTVFYPLFFADLSGSHEILGAGCRYIMPKIFFPAQSQHYPHISLCTLPNPKSTIIALLNHLTTVYFDCFHFEIDIVFWNAAFSFDTSPCTNVKGECHYAIKMVSKT